MEALVERFMDSALSIAILATIVIKEQREKKVLWERLNSCLMRIEEHLEADDG